jgi:GNAT superfamily N-acetyltransferase
MSITYRWRANFDNVEINRLHSEAFETADSTWRDWQAALTAQSLGWVVARDGEDLVGFVNVVWDGLSHAWIQDTMVTGSLRSQGIGTRLVNMAGEQAKGAGCEWLHVDFDNSLGDFYYGACGFSSTAAGLLQLA